MNCVNQIDKNKMKNLDQMLRVDMECEILNDDSLYQYFGGDENLSNIQKMSDKEMRDKIMDWIIEGNEVVEF